MRRAPLLLALAFALLMPASTASWVMKGDLEPSTTRDATGGYMFLTAPRSASAAGDVYFNGWMSNGYVVNPALNPNLGQVGSGAAAVPIGTAIAPADAKAWALLGVWMDCNKDGYVGLGDPGLFEYPVQAPGVDLTLCPMPTVPITKVPKAGQTFTPPHNDGKWIHEFLPIGWNQWATYWDDTDPENGRYVVTDIDPNPWDLNDSKARVWVDYQLPEAQGGGSGGCYLVPHPRGTYHSTGGIVEEYDCFTSWRVTDVLTSANSTLDSTALGNLTFKDKPRDQSESRSALNKPNPWGDEKDGSYVQPWNCEASQVRSGNPTTPGDPHDSLVNVSMPRTTPGGADPNPSVAGTLNATLAGFDQCHRKPAPSYGNVPYVLEGDVVNTAVKIMPDDTLHYNQGFRREGPTGALGPGTPRDLGLRTTGHETCATSTTSVAGELFATHTCHEGMWKGTTSSLFAGSSFVNRDTISPSRVRHVTFYAFVGPTADTTYGLDFPGTSVGSYGSENCALPAALRLFECDPAKWWPGNTMERDWQLGAEPGLPPEECTALVQTSCTPVGVRVGQAYQLRDIDCYDHASRELRREGIHYGILSQSQCA